MFSFQSSSPILIIQVLYFLTTLHMADTHKTPGNPDVPERMTPPEKVDPTKPRTY